MPSLQLNNVHKTFGTVAAVSGATLAIPDGSLVCLLGPSGCGKTTLLRLIAGLEEPTSGDMHLGEKLLNNIPPHKRNLGMVFQSLALFPHLNVGSNIAYPLKIRKFSRQECDSRVGELLELVKLPGMAGRSVSQLSGGQRQRVAIARALAVEPELFLLDEPLSALDAKLREEMQIELRQLQQTLGVTTVIVTHDQREAMSMSDQIAIMSNGVIQQIASPTEMYRNPVNPFVADFLGKTNFLTVRDSSNGAEFSGGCIKGLKVPADRNSLVSVRPEDVTLHQPGQETTNAVVTFVRDLGTGLEIHLDASGQELVAAISTRQHADHKIGDSVSVGISPNDCIVFEDERKEPK